MASASNAASLAWVNGARNLDFRWLVGQPEKSEIRTIDVTSAGHDLLADSRLVAQLPSDTSPPAGSVHPCTSALIANDGTIVCGSWVGSNAADVCAVSPPTLTTYSASTGQLIDKVALYQGRCVGAETWVAWAGLVNGDLRTLVIVVARAQHLSLSGDTNLIRLVSGDHLGAAISLPFDATIGLNFDGSIAF